jgi:hypothetical protein
MAMPLQSGWESASVLSSQKPITNYESSNLDSTIESPCDEVTKTGECTQNPPPKISLGALWYTDEGDKAEIRR